MNEVINFLFSELLLILVIPFGIALYFSLKFIKINVLSNRFKKSYRNYFALFELLIWSVFSLWTLRIIFDDTIFYSMFIFTIFGILSIWIGWFIAKDFVAGVVLKVSDKYQEGQFFRLNEIKGNITEVNYLHLNVIQANGEIIKIPFSRILGSVHHKSFLDDKSKKNKFQLMVEKQISLEETREKIRKTIFLSTGIDIKKEPIISLMDSSETSWKFEITYFILDEQFCELIENNVKSSFQ